MALVRACSAVPGKEYQAASPGSATRPGSFFLSGAMVFFRTARASFVSGCFLGRFVSHWKDGIWGDYQNPPPYIPLSRFKTRSNMIPEPSMFQAQPACMLGERLLGFRGFNWHRGQVCIWACYDLRRETSRVPWNEHEARQCKTASL